MDISLIDQAIELVTNWDYEYERGQLDTLIDRVEEMPTTLLGVPIPSVQNLYRQFIATMEKLIAAKLRLRNYFDRYAATLVAADGDIQLRRGEGDWGIASVDRENPLNGSEQLLVSSGGGIIVWHETFSRESLSSGMVYTLQLGGTLGMPVTDTLVLAAEETLYTRPLGELSQLVRNQVAVAESLTLTEPMDSFMPLMEM